MLCMRIRELAHSRPRFGYERIHILLRREGWLVGQNRVHRLYQLEGLQVQERVLEHGFRARSAGKQQGISCAHGDR